MANPKEFRSDLEGLKLENPTWRLIIGGKSPKDLQRDLKHGGFQVSSYAEDMLEGNEFATLEKPEEIDLVRLKVGDLGFRDYTTTEELYRRAQELGLELCPAEVGPHLRLAYKNQPMEEWLYVGMKQITDRHGHLDVFALARYGGGTWLYDSWAYPSSSWDPDNEFIFGLRKFNKA